MTVSVSFARLNQLICLPNTKLRLFDSSEAIRFAHLSSGVRPRSLGSREIFLRLRPSHIMNKQDSGTRKSSRERPKQLFTYKVTEASAFTFIKCWMICYVIIRPFRLMVYWLPKRLRKYASQEKGNRLCLSTISVWTHCLASVKPNDLRNLVCMSFPTVK